MNTNYLAKSVKLAALAAVLSYGTSLHATTSTTPPALNVSIAGQNEFQPMTFSDSQEAGMLHRAYRILATGDHDYKGHRVRAMHQIEAAAKLLGLDLSGDLKDRQPQVLSDDKMREASGLISSVLNSAAVKDQTRIVKHLTDAVNQINAGLSVK
jgi:hypothetical protein